MSNRQLSNHPLLIGIIIVFIFSVREEDVITPAPVVAQYCRENKLRPHLFVRDGI